MVWHYLNWSRMPEIVVDGCLRPTSTILAAGVPLIWFTASQDWDRTSASDVLGSVRFGLRVDDERLVPWWHVFVSQDADPAQFVTRLELTGADRDEWFATEEALPLGDLTFEALRDSSGHWAWSFTNFNPVWKPADAAAVARAYIADEAWARSDLESLA
jgi:hypothetical protein